MRIAPSILSVLIFSIGLSTAYANGITGSWGYDGPAHSGMWLKTQQAGSKVHFQLELSRGEPSYNSGWIEGEFDLKGTIGAFRTNKHGACEISFNFKGESVLLQETEGQQDCGFGANVYADGTLRRTSATPPKFADSDPRYGSK